MTTKHTEHTSHPGHTRAQGEKGYAG